MTFAAPSPRTSVTMRRKASRKRCGPVFAPPFHFPFQGNHDPFTSVPNSARTGVPKSRAAAPHARKSASKSPRRTCARVKRLFGFRLALSSSISRMNGTLPAARIQVAVASGKARLRYQLFEK